MMFELENLNDIEKIQESLEQLNDVMGSTKLAGFEKISDHGNEAIAEYLKDTIPTEHLEGCPEIKYDPENRLFTENPHALGVYHTDTRKIEVASESRFESVDDLLDTIVHETGHNVYANLEKTNPSAIERWEQMYKESKEFGEFDAGFGFVSEYAKTSRFEDFAESYRAYVRDPELLKFMNATKYEFMKYQVFEGKEYLRDAFAISCELPATHLDGLLTQDVVVDISSMSRESLLDAVGRNLYTEFIIYTPSLESEFLALMGGEAGVGAFSSLYGEYIIHGDELLQKNPQQYNFMKDRIFHGIEYSVKGDDLMDKITSTGVLRESKSVLSGCEQLDYYADTCIQLDIIATSPRRSKKEREDSEVDELLNADSVGDTLFLSGCAKRCVKCEIKSSACSYS